MRYPVSMCLLLIQLLWVTGVFAQDKQPAFSRANFYKAMREENEDAVNQQLEIIKTAELKDRTGFEGALLMKKAGLVGGPKKKLDLFKAGHKKLDGLITKDSSNAELRFLRLMIQEHAPGILGYKKDLDKDKQYVASQYKKLPKAVQEAMTDYSKQSKILKPEDL